MKKVAQFIQSASHRQALSRLCRLACQAAKDGRRILDNWENLHRAIPLALSEAIQRLDDDPQSIEAPEISADPLLWLGALDEHCRQEISPDSYLSGDAIDDGMGRSWVVPLYPGQGGGARRKQYGNLAKWMEHHRVVPLDNPDGIPVAVTGLPQGYVDWTTQRTGTGAVEIAIMHFIDGVTTEVVDTAPAHFICPGLTDAKQRFDSALKCIADAKAAGMHILVMPELTITPDVRADLVEAIAARQSAEGEDHSLAVPIIVLGSFHEAAKDGFRNHATAVSGLDGTSLLECDKRKSVTIKRPGTAEERKEGITCAPTPITCLFTPLGLIAIAICKDLFETEPSNALASLPLDWMLVPSMSDSLTPHKGTAKTLHNTSGMVVVVANQEMPGSAEPRPGFVHHAEVVECDQGLHFVSVARVEPPAREAPRKRSLLTRVK